jgi:hypothetical protein
MHKKCWLESLKGRDHSEDLGVDGRIILKCIVGKWSWGIDWIHLPKDRDRWRAFVKTVINSDSIIGR